MPLPAWRLVTGCPVAEARSGVRGQVRRGRAHGRGLSIMVTSACHSRSDWRPGRVHSASAGQQVPGVAPLTQNRCEQIPCSYTMVGRSAAAVGGESGRDYRAAEST